MDLTNKEKVDALLKFIEIAANGSIKPYNHDHFLSKVEKMGVGQKELFQCCPPQAEIRDSKDFKPYMMAAVKKLSELLELEDIKDFYGHHSNY
jgi:hypothetical protein